jgi:DNA-binding transcriptional LysR family regulator
MSSLAEIATNANEQLLQISIVKSETMNLNYLLSFYWVVKLGSFSKAAKKLYFSQPTISLHIQKLEGEIGLPLIDYHQKVLCTTEAGSRLFRFAEQLFQEKIALEHDFDVLRAELVGTLFLITTRVPGGYVLPDIFGQFKRQYPSIGVNVGITDPVKVSASLQSGEYELGVGTHAPENIDKIKIAQDEVVLVVYPGHKLFSKTEASLDDLTNETFIMRAEPLGEGYSLSDLLKNAGVDLIRYKSRMVMGTHMGVLAGVESRAGIAFMSTLVVKQHEAFGRVKTLRLEGITLKREYYCMYYEDKVFSRIGKEFINFLKNNVPPNF